MRPGKTSIEFDQATADEVRQMARELAAQQRQRVTLADAVRAAVAAWRQLADPRQAGHG